jgi:CelD/BcsL family acetyltransferase involved in cellulose biosynthesis
MPLKIKRIDSSEFDSLQGEWNELLRHSACDTVFLRWEWIHTWWGIFAKDRKLFILTARQEDRLIGIAPFYIDSGGLLRPRTLKLCSEELSPDYMDVIIEKGQEADVARELANYVIEHADEWDVMALDNLRADSILLTDPSLFRDYHPNAQISQRCPYIKIQSTFEDYYKTRSELITYSLEKKLKVLTEEKKATHKTINEEPGFSKGLDDLFLLHEMRAASQQKESNFLSPEVQRFHHELGRTFLKERILNLQLLYHGEVPLAAFYAFQYKNKVHIYQTGFDPQWRKWSAGNVLLYLGVQKAFTEGFAEFDFLKGMENYKTLWSTGVRDEMKLTVYNKTLRGSFWRGMKNLRSALGRVKRLSVLGSRPAAQRLTIDR